MVFRTEYKPIRSDFTLNPLTPVVMVGSCFSDNIAVKMKQAFWEAVNPTGTLYNPLSIAESLRLCLLSLFPDSEFEKSLFLSDSKYRSWLFDSRLSSFCAPDSMAAFRKMREELFQALAKGKTLIVTFGTARAYFLQTNHARPVGNCHKQPASLFINRLLDIDEIVEAWDSLIQKLQTKFEGFKVIFTLSPVRHLKDGFEGNSISKAVLRMAIMKICRNNDCCRYFPAYEILNDDLRDYRFYASDMVHPSEAAIDYIWNIFKDTFLDDAGKQRLRQGEDLKKALSHRQHPDASRLIPEEVEAERKKRIEELNARLNSFLSENL